MYIIGTPLKGQVYFHHIYVIYFSVDLFHQLAKQFIQLWCPVHFLHQLITLPVGLLSAGPTILTR